MKVSNYLWNDERSQLSYRLEGEEAYRSVQVVTTGEVEHYDGDGDAVESRVPAGVMRELVAKMKSCDDKIVRERFARRCA